MNLDDPLIALISEKISAELAAAAESKRLADATEESTRLRQKEIERENRRSGLLVTTVERYAQLGELVKEFLAVVQAERKELLAIIETERKEESARRGVQREFNNTLSERVDNLEQGIYAILTRDIAEMQRSQSKIGATIDRRGELQTLYRNLQRLQDQAARHGMDVPLNIQNAIDDTERKIEEIKE